MNESDIAFMTVAQLAEQIQGRKLSPVEVTRVLLGRIARANGQLAAFITVTQDEALAAARQAEREIAQGMYRGPLHGIPFGVKDQVDTKGIRTTYGSRVFKEHVPEQDATVVARLRDAGGVLLGKQNMPEFAMGPSHRFPYGTPRNPWNLNHTPGASSSGSGSSLAAGLCIACIGEDSGGSIRQPAAHSGVTGLRPTWGLVPRDGTLAIEWSMDAVGPMARTAEDCAIILGYLAGRTRKDPWTFQGPVPDFRASLTGHVRGLRVGIVRECMDAVVSQEVRAAHTKAVEVLSAKGAVVSEVSLPLGEYAGYIYVGIADGEASSYHRGVLKHHAGELDYNTRVRLLAGSVVPTCFTTLAMRARRALAGQIAQAYEKFDLLTCPTCPDAAPWIVELGPISTDKGIRQAVFAPHRMLTQLAAIYGGPAISIPCGFTSGGLPVGLQLMGPRNHDAQVLNAAHAYQLDTDWHTRRPPMDPAKG